MRESYGMKRYFGQGCLAARRLVEAGCKFVTVFWDGFGQFASCAWDTHDNHYPRLKEYLLPGLDRALPGLLLDLEARGLLDETLVLWMSEHGRTPKIDSKAKGAGRHHWSTRLSRRRWPAAGGSAWQGGRQHRQARRRSEGDAGLSQGHPGHGVSSARHRSAHHRHGSAGAAAADCGRWGGATGVGELSGEGRFNVRNLSRPTIIESCATNATEPLSPCTQASVFGTRGASGIYPEGVTSQSPGSRTRAPWVGET